ncbi:MFS transporter [Paenibacillus sp. NEAU-GSW1]|uniref:MFS transporter n=1 Tax=Paenibacillus sp. NEAU-GSW1 TaxID=2682486 RepID=UPI0012E21162|nr:MFS transporter [Paenibacillus sp. NEAU-GSW1]MUT66136.1 MFS transporter [Paenibacillus sp. NEAU-GSW1]
MNQVTASAQRSRQIWRSPFIIQLLAIMFIVEFVKGALVVSILPVYMGTVLGLSAYAIGWSLALLYIGDNAFRSPLGWVVDRIGYRYTMLFGVILTFISVLIAAFMQQTLWLVFSCLLLGIGTSPLWPCVITGATGAAGEDSGGTVMSVVYMAWLTGIGGGPIVINFFISSSYTTAFHILIGAMTIAAAITLLLPGRAGSKALEPVEDGHDASDMKGSGQSEKRSLLARAADYIGMLRNSLHVSKLLFPAMFAQNLALGLLTPILTLYARTVLDLSPKQFSLFLIAGGAITALGLIPVGKLVDRYGTKWPLHIGFVLAGISLPLLGMSRWLPAVMTIVAFVGIGYACIIPAWNAFIAEAIPKKERGAVWGFFLTIEGCGSVLGSILSGRMWDSFGPHMPFLLSGGVMFLLFVLHLFITKPQPVMVR